MVSTHYIKQNHVRLLSFYQIRKRVAHLCIRKKEFFTTTCFWGALTGDPLKDYYTYYVKDDNLETMTVCVRKKRRSKYMGIKEHNKNFVQLEW
jgi:hypothetical protein